MVIGQNNTSNDASETKMRHSMSLDSIPDDVMSVALSQANVTMSIDFSQTSNTMTLDSYHVLSIVTSDINSDPQPIKFEYSQINVICDYDAYDKRDITSGDPQPKNIISSILCSRLPADPSSMYNLQNVLTPTHSILNNHTSLYNKKID